MSTKPLHLAAPEKVILPNFIISGAMKCGTTSLHTILVQHPDVFISQSKLYSYDMDHIAQYPDFNPLLKRAWQTSQLKKCSGQYWQWSSPQFKKTGANQLKGEDSTTHLASELIIKRIAQQNIKIITMLQQPSARVYSHYWHIVKVSRTLYSFEYTLKFASYHLLGHSAYLKQLKQFFTYLDQVQIKVILFESFIEDKTQTMAEVCSPLELDYSKSSTRALNIHANHACTLWFVNLYLLKYNVFCYVSNQYLEHFYRSSHKQFFLNNVSVFERLYYLNSRLVRKISEKINSAIKKILDEYFSKELNGLDELLEYDILSKWFN